MKHDTAYLVKSGFLREKIGDWGWQNGLTDHRSMVRKALTLMALFAFAIPQFVFSVANATVPQIVVVPFSQNNPLSPHPVHRGARVMLKGIMRNADCGSYRVIWDTNRNNEFETNGADTIRDVSPSTFNTVYDISVNYEVPDNIASDQNWFIGVKAINNCTNETAFSTYRMFAYAWRPNTSVHLTEAQGGWTADQVQIMGQIAIQEGLWYLHRQMTNRQSSGSTIWAEASSTGSNMLVGEALAIWAYMVNSRYPAYPPNSIKAPAANHSLPANFQTNNTNRWNTDPYAETAIRYINHLLNNAGRIGIPTSDEDNTCRFGDNNSECPEGGTGAYIVYGNYVYYQAIMLASMVPVLQGLARTEVQTGAYAGVLWEKFVQDLTDTMAWQQQNDGRDMGAWNYSADSGMDFSTAQWGYIGLESAVDAGGSYKVRVMDQHKYKAIYSAIRNETGRGQGFPTYQTDCCYDGNRFNLTGGYFVASRMGNVHNLNPNGNSLPYSNGYSARNYVDSINRARSFVANNWNGFFNNSNYYCNDTTSLYPATACANLYGLYSLQKGFRTGLPEESGIGRDWFRELSIYIMRAQDRSVRGLPNTDFGRVYDGSYAQSYGNNSFVTSIGVLMLTPALFNPKPVALINTIPSPIRVIEGCSSPTDGQVTFKHQDSFHPNPTGVISAYQWDVDDSAGGNGLWWVTGAPADFSVGTTYVENGNVLQGKDKPFVYRYMKRGNYTANFRVVDTGGLTATAKVPVQVDASPDVAPVASHGGPYIMEVGDNLVLRGTASDANTGCGDVLTSAWEITAGSNAFDDLNSAAGTVNWSRLSNLTVGVANNIRLRVKDATNRISEVTTQLTIYPKEPVARGTAAPNPSACQQEIVFDASASYHPNPNRRITTYEWDIDRNIRSGYDGGGADKVFRYTYSKYGTYNVRLKVTDDLNRISTYDGITINVNQGNNAPVARVLKSDVLSLEGASLDLDATPSFDSNLACGDSIVSYDWDIDGNGSYGDAVDVNSNTAKTTLSWNTVQAKFGWQNGQISLQKTVTVRVRDTFGQTSTAQMNVTIYKADPIATFDQIPSPAPIDQQTGRVDVTLDARESYSPVPGGSIVRYEWDFNGGNIFGDGAGASVVVFRKIYNNLNPNNIPKPTVKLRVTDDKGRQTVFQKNISYGIGDVPPTADADPSDAPEIGYHILQGDSLTLSAAQSVEPNVGDRIRFYRWRLNYNPNTENYQTLSNWDFNIEDANGDRVEEILVVPPARLAQLGMANLGTYPIVMEVQDTTFLRARDRSTITVHPVNPIAVATIDPTLAACGQRITLDGSASKHTHPAITIVSYEWDMNSNGTYNDPVDVTGKTTTVLANQYTFNGPTTITLRITDSRGNRATAQVSLNVNQGNSAPSVNPGGPYYIALADAKLKLNGSLSVEPNATCGDQIVSYRWDVGNNGGFEAALENVVSPELTMAQLANYLGSSAKGVYKVKLETRDRFGAISSAITDINIIQGPTAIASVAPSTASCNAVVQFDAGGSFTDGPINQGFALSDFRWDLDGNEVNGFETVGKTVSRNAVDFAGTKTVRLSVSDASGRVSQISTNYTITINNLPPRSSAGGPYTAAIINNVKQAITLDARASTDPNLPCDQLTRYDWDTDDDNLFGAEDTNGVPGRAGSDYSGDVVNGYINPNWNVGLTYPVKVRTCDRSYTGAGSINTACNVAATEIFITNNAPPQAELTYPRSTDCVADTNFQVRATVKDQEGGVIQAKVTVDGVVMVTENINTTANQVYNYQTTIDARRFPEGFKAVAIEFTDSQNGKTIVNSGGNVPFDRTPPQVDIGNLLLANVCYANNQVPIVTPTISDNVDLSPVVNQEVLSNSCEKTLKVTGKDRCNNQTIVSRLYRVAEPVGIDLSAPADNALVASTTINWSLLSPPSCVNEITANISYNGQERVYGPNTLLDVAGDYTFTLNVPNCIGDTVQYRRAFKINGKPVALPVPAGHPSADNAAQIPTYLTTEGAVLRLEGDDSRPPELGDSISAWRWDYNRDGTIDAQGMQVLYNTNQNGVFPGALTVADSFGLTHTQNFEVVITDVNPILDLGGPYSIAQGQPLSFNASASRPANDADPLNQFIWTWGDNTANSTLGIPAGFTPIHTYDEDGQYEVRVTLKDEDSQVQKMIQVNVRDVQPEIIGIEVPAVAYALQDLTFVANARTNAPADPIVSYDWDFLGNGRFQEQPNPETIYQYLEEGTYQAVLRVRDDDSFTTRNFTVVVRGVSLSDILRDIKLKVNELYQSQQISDRAKAAVNPDGQKTILELCDLGLWAEAQRDLIAEGNLIEHTERMRSFYRGNTLMIFDEILFRLNRAQSLGTDLGLTMWKISRQLLREVEGYQNQIISQYAMANIDPSFAQAQNLIVVAKQIFNNVDFLDRVIGRDGYLARDLYGVLYESFFLLRNYTDPTRIYNEFPMPTEGDPVRRVFDANAVNDDLAAALAQIQSELADYLLAASNAQTPGPGVQPISDAVQALAQIQAWIAKKIGLVCVNADPTSPECDFLSDRDNLYLQLALMDLVGNLFAAADQGVYVRNLQNLLTFAVKFRVEVALLAVEQQCGVYNPYPMAARAQQEILLNLLDQKQNDAALLFYIAPERRCLVMQQYNECVVPALNRRRAIDDQISKEVYPEFCEASGLAGAQQGVVIPGQDLPIPYRQPLIDVTLLYDIIRAFILDLNPANPVVLANSFPGRTWKEMNRYYRDQNFDLNDVNTALVQFNHDIYDVDQDGIIGIVEIDCDIKFNIPLDPNRARSIDNIEDGKRDCDADGISNEEEVRIKLNPVEAADAQLDTDADGLTNFDEWKWAKLGLPVDLRDPTDAAKDFDMDGVSNVKEIKAGFDPINMMDVAGDFDGDGLSNAVELNNGLDPRNRADADQDPDMDMLSSRQEIARGRNPLVKDCEADTVELSGRDDSAITARTVQFTDGYAEFSQGVICGSRNNNDEDWFAIEIPDNGYRLSVAVRATNGDTAISARLYDSVNQAQLAVSETLYPSELVVMARNQLNFGRYLVKISHTQGDLAPQTPYFVTFHLTPPTRPCLSDHLEGMTNNNQMTSAYIVGNTSVRDGAVWVCDGERNVGDWYRVDVSNKDKTVHIGYAPNTDGKLELSAMTQDFSAYAESTDVQKSGQCINIKASGIPTAVYINVTASTVFSDGDDRVDYTLQILETDLLARPRGECDVLNNGLYQFYTWPTLGL